MKWKYEKGNRCHKKLENFSGNLWKIPREFIFKNETNALRQEEQDGKG